MGAAHGRRVATVVLAVLLAACGSTTDDDQGQSDPGNGQSLDELTDDGVELFLTIDDPANGQVITTERYTFRGSTTPGATVRVGESIVVPVDEDGSWQIRLRLRPGSNVSTITAERGAGDPVLAQVQVVYEVPGGDDPTVFSP